MQPYDCSSRRAQVVLYGRLTLMKNMWSTFKKMYIFILTQFFPTASSPNNQPSAKVVKSLFSPFMFFLLKVLLK